MSIIALLNNYISGLNALKSEKKHFYFSTLVINGIMLMVFQLQCEYMHVGANW